MKKIFPIFLIIFSLLAVSSSAYALPAGAQDPTSANFQILPCDGTSLNGGTECNYESAVAGFKNIIKFIMVLSIPFATAMFGYAGFLYMRAGDNPGNKEKAKKIFLNIAIGFALVLGAWLIVHTLIGMLTNSTISSGNSV